MTSIERERTVLRAAFVGLPVRLQYAFLLLSLERMVEIAAAVFPTGLPTRRVPYGNVRDSMVSLWGRLPDAAQSSEVAASARSWRPLTTGGTVEHAAGASLGMFIAELAIALSTASLDRSMGDQFDALFEMVGSLLFRMSDPPDYTRDLVASELDPILNRSLLLEFRTQLDVIQALDSNGPENFEGLRELGRAAAQRIASWEGSSLAQA